MTSKQKEQVKLIENILSTQRFYNFYKDGGEYEEFITSKQTKKQNEEMQEKIFELFRDVINS